MYWAWYSCWLLHVSCVETKNGVRSWPEGPLHAKRVVSCFAFAITRFLQFSWHKNIEEWYICMNISWFEIFGCSQKLLSNKIAFNWKMSSLHRNWSNFLSRRAPPGHWEFFSRRKGLCSTVIDTCLDWLASYACRGGHYCARVRTWVFYARKGLCSTIIDTHGLRATLCTAYYSSSYSSTYHYSKTVAATHLPTTTQKQCLYMCCSGQCAHVAEGNRVCASVHVSLHPPWNERPLF